MIAPSIWALASFQQIDLPSRREKCLRAWIVDHTFAGRKWEISKMQLPGGKRSVGLFYSSQSSIVHPHLILKKLEYAPIFIPWKWVSYAELFSTVQISFGNMKAFENLFCDLLGIWDIAKATRSNMILLASSIRSRSCVVEILLLRHWNQCFQNFVLVQMFRSPGDSRASLAVQ